LKITDLYIPVCANGYDLALLNKLAFNDENVFIGFEKAHEGEIEAYETYMKKRNETMFSKEIIDVFHKLGTYSNFVAIYAPILYNGKPVGILSFENFKKKKFSPQSKQILKIYAQMISNFYSISRQKEIENNLLTETIESLVSAIEIKDAYTDGHGKRVMEFSENISIQMKLSHQEVENIKLAALLHDIGKIGIPTEVLNKPDKLTASEYDLVKTHPEKSKHVLSKIKNFSVITDLVYHHHEYYDGNGYPNGIKGDEIPLGAQIISVADAFDAMTSKRAYRDKISNEDAIAILIENSGKQFHPHVVKAALQVLPRAEDNSFCLSL